MSAWFLDSELSACFKSVGMITDALEYSQFISPVAFQTPSTTLLHTF